MKQSRFTEAQIIRILKEQESGSPAAEVCRKHGISSATFYLPGTTRLADRGRVTLGPRCKPVMNDRKLALKDRTAAIGRGEPRE